MAIRNCPICNTPSDSAQIFLKKNIDQSQLSEFSYASRKLPEFMCHQLVKCPNCDLVYANDPPDQSALAEAYHVSDFDSNEEANDAALAYASAVKPLLNKIKNKGVALEIGTGTGIFLEHLLKAGFERVIGIEPSTAAINAAPEHRKKWILESIFKEGDFEPNSLDFICCFMTLEHVLDPNEIVSAASRLLKPGGGIALVTHDYNAGVNRLLGSKSPIIDIEHMQLFTPKSIYKLLENNTFIDIDISSFYNKYSLQYWVRLLPINSSTKKGLIDLLSKINISNKKIKLNVGNIVSCAIRK